MQAGDGKTHKLFDPNWMDIEVVTVTVTVTVEAVVAVAYGWVANPVAGHRRLLLLLAVS